MTLYHGSQVALIKQKIHNTKEVIQVLYEMCVSSVKMKIRQTNWFNVETDLWQVSPFVSYITVMDGIHKSVKQVIESEETNTLLFLDNIVVWGEDEMEVQARTVWN